MGFQFCVKSYKHTLPCLSIVHSCKAWTEWMEHWTVSKLNTSRLGKETRIQSVIELVVSKPFYHSGIPWPELSPPEPWKWPPGSRKRESSRSSNLILAQEWKRQLPTLNVEIFHFSPLSSLCFLVVWFPRNPVAIVATADDWSLQES